MKPSKSITTKSIYDETNDQYNTIYSNRGIEATVEELKAISIRKLYKKVWSQDDFGLVTVYTVFNDAAIRFVIENTNRGFRIRAWSNNLTCYELDGMLGGDQLLVNLLNR